ncbi:hypothetical protein LTR56_020570 [Elasticomyces elasticus]|nr:hypothetical protein LTR56_020570 [Elasticomyces elasticus]KAK3655823.1 hypothetical protein LTR22_010117 [Elasticomyces elasticus]KAK4925837.1 hypothetical protein LTR49_007214 [Elasticomyces elasticus]KAK5764791.1 hypothetical protein LTS12_005061 [Elasticomyces elasticus]
MRDRMLLKLYNAVDRPLKEADVLRAIDGLDDTQKVHFVQLHEGATAYSNEIMRIYMANSFRKGAINYLCPTMASLNHSCSPNTERIIDKHDKNFETLVAVKHIVRGDEIFTSYFGFPFAVTKKARITELQTHYGFICDCQACVLTSPLTAISDARRTLIDVLKQKTGGFAQDFRMVDPPPSRPEDMFLFGKVAALLKSPLTMQQRVAYWILLAKLCEAEGLLSSHVVRFYASGVLALRFQMLQLGDLVVCASARVLNFWMSEAQRLAKEICGCEAQMTENVDDIVCETRAMNMNFALATTRMEDETRSGTTQGYSKGFSLNSAFAVLWDGKGQNGGRPTVHALDEEMCILLMRGEKTQEDVKAGRGVNVYVLNLKIISTPLTAEQKSLTPWRIIVVAATAAKQLGYAL